MTNVPDTTSPEMALTSPDMPPSEPDVAQAGSEQVYTGPGVWRKLLGSGRVVVGGGILLVVLGMCLVSMPWTTDDSGNSDLYFDQQNTSLSFETPNTAILWQSFGTDMLGRSLLGRCLLGGGLSLAIGVAAALIALVLGTAVGLVAGYMGGRVDAALMRLVDILYGLPYVLMVILLKLAMGRMKLADPVVIFAAIGLVSWLTMARVVRGQVLSLRSQPFIEAARALGVPRWRIFLRHLLPNLVGPIIVYATLTVPQAILQESFLSFLGIGVNEPLPTWGKLASDGLLVALNPVDSKWWLLLFPCLLLGVTLLALNFLGDGLRDVFDPRHEGAKL